MARGTSASALVVGGLPRVNLMPPAELERRYRRTLLKRWVLGLMAAVLLTVLVIGGAFTSRFLADARLAAERDRTDALIAEIASLSAVGATVSTLADLTAYREDAMIADLEWAALLDSLRGSLPADVTVIGFDVTTGSGPVADEPDTAPGATVLLTLASAVPFDIVPAVRGLRTVPAVLAADGTGMRYDESKERYVAELAVLTTQTAYSGRFAPKEGEQ